MKQQFVVYSGSFAKAAKIEILNVKTFSTGDAAMEKATVADIL